MWEGGLSCCKPPRAGCQTKNCQTHTPKKCYRGVPQCRKALQPYILVRVEVGVFLREVLVLQPYNTNLPKCRKKLPVAMAKEALQP